MKIKVLGDVESSYIWDHYKPGMLRGFDLIISCGDLNPNYLTFVETFANVPLLYVHGNHDEKYKAIPPEGCVCIEDSIYVHNGIRILGLGGCMRYRPGAHQYTEAEMEKRVKKLRRKIKRLGGIDILVTHAPMRGFHDGEDTCHQGFAVFEALLNDYQPKYFLHGHVHMNYGLKTPRVSQFAQTTVINAYRSFDFDYENPPEK
ncbi:MAG: metallophosphoesterase family protein [Oscillospiraceae bacterium]|nr:metallophosphoesterase family protein [Oscillospiraceae bacterium]